MLSRLTAVAVLALLLSPSLLFAKPPRTPVGKSKIFSQTSIEKGWKAAVQGQRPMLVMFTSDNCRFCKKMLSETYGHPAIERMLAANTQTVLAHAEDYEGLVKKLGIRGYPSSVLVSPKGDVLELVEGFLPPEDFAKRIVPVLQASAKETRSAQLPQETSER